MTGVEIYTDKFRIISHAKAQRKAIAKSQIVALLANGYCLLADLRSSAS